MNIVVLAAFGAAVLVFGPGFLIQAGIGYIVGAGCGAYARNKMCKLHNEICGHTGDDRSAIARLGEYVMAASKFGGIVCPIIPIISVCVGLVCDYRADKLHNMSNHAGTLRGDTGLRDSGTSVTRMVCGCSAKGVRL